MWTPARVAHLTGPPQLSGWWALGEGGGQRGHRRPALLALGRGEVVAQADPAQLAAQPAHGPPPRAGRQSAGRLGGGGHRLVVGGGGGGHALGQGAFLGGGGRLGQPDGGLAAGVGDLLGQPFQLLAGAGVQGEGDQAVLELDGAQPAQLAPQRDPRGAGLAGEVVGEQDPPGPGRGNHGCTITPPMGSVETVVFVCQHGAAKSVLAAALAERLAAEHGLSLRC